LLAHMSELAPRIGGAVARVNEETLPRLNHALDAGAELAQRLDGQVDPVAADVRRLANTGADAMAQARDVLGEGKGDIHATLANLRGASGTLRERMPGTIDRVDAFLDEGHVLAQGLSASSDDLRAML